MNYAELCISHTALIRDAMRQLDRTAKKILFILKNEKLYGSLTDGDIRRFLISGGKLDDLVENAAYRHLKTAKTVAQGQMLLASESGNLTAVPIVGPDSTLLDIVLEPTGHEPPPPQLNLPVVIMAGGMGKRLDPYTRILPKPLIPIGAFPIIEHIMRQFEKYGCVKFHIIVNYKKQLIKAYFNENSHHFDITWYDENRPLGTGGGLHLLKERMQETFFFTNCDILLHSNYADILKFHRNNRNIITMVGAYKSLTLPYGVMDIGNDGILNTMKEKPELSFLTNTGVYIVAPEVLKDIPDNTSISFPEIIEIQRKKEKRVAVYPVNEDEWMDMGQLDTLRKMEEKLSSKTESD